MFFRAGVYTGLFIAFICPSLFRQVSFYALRVPVGMVSHVDLPLDDLLAALVNSAPTEVLGGYGNGRLGCRSGRKYATAQRVS